MATEFSKLIGSRIKYFRNLRSMTQAELAEKIGIESSTLAHIEIGKNLPSTSRLPKIAQALEIEIFQLFIKNEVKTDSETIEAINKLLKISNKTQLRLIYELIANAVDLSAKNI